MSSTVFNNSEFVFQAIRAVNLYRVASPAVTGTLSANLAKYAVTANIGTPGGLVSGDHVLIRGDGGLDLNTLTGAPGASTTLRYKCAFAQTSGAQIKRAERIRLGHVEQAGVTLAASQQNTGVPAATSRTNIATIPGAVEQTASLGLMGWSAQALALAFGLGTANNPNGDGTTANPNTVVMDGSTIATEGDACLELFGALVNGDLIRLVAHEVKAQINLNAALGGNAGAPIGLSFSYSALTYMQPVLAVAS